MSIPEIEKFIGTTVTENQFKQAYTQLIQTLDLEVANQNLVIDTNIVIDFINNRLNGGGGLVANGSVYIDGIPVGQSLVLEPEDEGYPLGLRKICINKQTKQFKIFNSLEKNSSEYLLLGVLWQRKWMTFSNGPQQPTIIANGIETYKGSIANLKYAADGEIVGGSLYLNKENKKISGTFTLYSSEYRDWLVADISYAGDLTAIVYDKTTNEVKALTDTDVLSPSHIVIAKVVGDYIFATSLNSTFQQEGNQKFKIVGKVDSRHLSSEPAFMSDDLRLKIDFSTGKLNVLQSGFIFCNGGYIPINSSNIINFNQIDPAFVRYLSFTISDSNFKFSQTRPINLGNQEVLLGYVYNYKFYGFGDFKNKITILNSSGQIIEDSSNTDVFNELNQRALLPNKLFFIENRALPLYKDSIFSNPKVGLEKVRTWIDTNNTDTLKRYIPVQQQTILNPSDISNNVQFVYAHSSIANKRYWKNVGVNKAVQSKLNRSFNMLCFGDSLTQVGTPWTLKNKLESLGAIVTSVGTFWSTESPNELPSEGRGYWNYRGFIGKDNVSGGTEHTRSEGGKTRTAKFENPFLKLATAQDKADHPTWCFRFTGSQKELSYTEDTDKTGNFYIFDFDWYMTKHSVPSPDFITIGLSTNDINLDRDVYSRDEVMTYMQLGLEIMIKQIHKVLPNVPIGVIPCPAWSATENGFNTFCADTATWIELCLKKVAQLKLSHSNLEVIPVYMHMNRDMGYPIVNNQALSVDSDVQVGTINDWVHYDQVGRDQYAEVVAGWLANVI
ncbi:SGNH/GDSL hydrolase family protein [Acinetobacter guillouiae]|uniref:SGNH/GDSL hydrolase family protein n=1 Tax=Acinetobacter guillouiae TaxID=106649 RepID=A0A8X8KDL1_ACIGI|nr:SGNH/GDSL hydrolase family protein [Acinetobacter guillouiae]MCF0265989.1 SGNH/GDSL hydrolase family protein [Acinetobacter guillouiae]